MGPITVGYDGSKDAQRAASWAAAVVTRLGGVPLHLVHALSLPSIPAQHWELRVDELLDHHEAEMRVALEHERSELTATGATVEIFVRRWLPVETLLEHVRDHRSELLVVGQHGYRSGRLLLGSVSSAVAREATVPVVVTRGRETVAPPRVVLLAFDGSKGSRRAAETVARLFPDAHVRAVRIRDEKAEGNLEALASLLDEIGIDRSRVELRSAEGPAAETILDLAAEPDVDLLAAGRRGLSAWRELLLGGVSDKLLQLAPCPVLVAH